jgi:type II secretory pathway pseudopilin PulG
MASESKEEPELPVMRQMYAIINIIDLLHDITQSRGGPGADIVQNLTLDDDIDFNVLYRLIQDGGDRKKIMAYYNKQPYVYATLRNLLIDIASIITGESVSIEDAGCICIGEIKSQFGYFSNKNPYLFYEKINPKDIRNIKELPESFRFIGASNYVLETILRLTKVTHWFTEATGNAQDYLKNAVRAISEVEEAIAVASGVDPGPKISGNPENDSLYNLSVDPVLGNIIVRFNEGRYTVEFGDDTFSGITLNRLPNTCLATAIASLIPNLMRHITKWRRESSAQMSLGQGYNSNEPEYSEHSQTSNSGAAAATVPPNPQTEAHPPFEEYLQGVPIDDGDAIEAHIEGWSTSANINSLTSKKVLNYLIKLVKTYTLNATKSGRADIKKYDEYDPAFTPENADIEEEERQAIAAYNKFISDLCDEQSLASGAGGKAKRARTCDIECGNLGENELKNICALALAVLKKCLRTRGTFKDRIQTAIKTILTLKSWGDRLQMEELMTLINVGDTCAIASKDKLFLANCILYANITGRHIITVEYFSRGSDYFMSIMNHDGSRGASLTSEQKAVRERERAAAEAERAVAAAERAAIEEAERKAARAAAAAKQEAEGIIWREELYPPRTSFAIGETRESRRLRAERQVIIEDFNRTDPTHNIIEVPDDGKCFLNAVIKAGGYDDEQFNDFNDVIGNPGWGGSPDDIRNLSTYLDRDILVIIKNPGKEGERYVRDETRRFPVRQPIYIFDYQQAESVQRHFDAVVPKAVGGFRSHRQRKTLKKRKGRHHTRRRT